MQNSIRGTVRNGKIELPNSVTIPEGTEVIVTLVPEDLDFWMRASESSLAAIWDNTEDDVYAELLKK